MLPARPWAARLGCPPSFQLLYPAGGVDPGFVAYEAPSMTPVDVVHRLAEVEAEVVRGLGVELLAYPSCAAALCAYLASCQQRSPTIEAKISIPDPALQTVFEALCARYGLPVYRKPRQRKTTFTVSGPAPFIHDVLNVMFQQMADAFDALFIAQTEEILRSFAAIGIPNKPAP